MIPKTDPEAVKTMLRKVNTLLHRRGWHEGHEAKFWFVYQNADGSLIARPGPGGMIPRSTDDPVWALYQMSLVIGDEFPSRAFGALFSAESWMVHGTSDTPLHELDQLDAAHRNRELHLHDRRVEVRNLAVVLRDGTEAMLVHKRDSDEVEVSCAPQGGRGYMALRRFFGVPEGELESVLACAAEAEKLPRRRGTIRTAMSRRCGCRGGCAVG